MFSATTPHTITAKKERERTLKNSSSLQTGKLFVASELPLSSAAFEFSLTKNCVSVENINQPSHHRHHPHHQQHVQQRDKSANDKIKNISVKLSVSFFLFSVNGQNICRQLLKPSSSSPRQLIKIMASRKVSRSSNGSSRTISVAFHVVRLLLVVLLALIFLISTVYFIRTIDAIGDDVDEARETHWGHTHEVEETPLNIEGSSGGGGKFDPYETDSAGDREENVASPRGRLILGKNYNEYAVTRSRAKQQHIVSLIVWVVLTLFAAILSLAGIIGALCGNMCMVRRRI